MALSFDSLTAAQIAAGVAAGDFTATEVAQTSLAAIEAREGGVQAFLAGNPAEPAPAAGICAAPCRPARRSYRRRPLRGWILPE